MYRYPGFTFCNHTRSRFTRRNRRHSRIIGVTLTTVPTDIVPSYNYVKVDVGVKDYLGNSEVIYQGGEGQIHVKKITAKMTRSDGQTQTEPLENKKGYTVELLGTKQVDRVEVWVSMDNGETYKINDVLLDYRIH